jgi:hypothetical protein
MTPYENVFRKEYRPLSEAEKAQIGLIEDKAQEHYDLIDSIEHSREKSIAKTHLEKSVMWSGKKITG